MKKDHYDANEDLLLDSAADARSLEQHLISLRAERRYHRRAYWVFVAFLALHMALLAFGQDLAASLATAGATLPLVLAHHHHGRGRSLLRQVQTVRLVQAWASSTDLGRTSTSAGASH